MPDRKKEAHSEFDPNQINDIKAYLRFAKFGATAIIGFFPSDPEAVLRRVEARGFTLITEPQPEGSRKFFTKNRIDTKNQDENGKTIYREVEGTFILAKLLTPEAYLFMTRDSSEYVRDGLLRMLYRARLDVCRLRLTSVELRTVLTDIVRETARKLVVRRAVLKNKRQESTVSYETESLDDLYGKADTSEAHVHSVAFKVFSEPDGKLLLHASFGRDGRFGFYAGDIEVFWREIVDPATQLAKVKKDLLTGRSRSWHSDDIKPLRVSFGERVFTNKPAIQAFLYALLQIRHGETTIFHRNPYLHVAFTDLFDASTFDIFVDTEDSIVIVPQFEITVPSLFRLCQKIFENFQEGSITQVSLSK